MADHTRSSNRPRNMNRAPTPAAILPAPPTLPVSFLELSGRVAELRATSRSIARRNRYLLATFIGAVAILLSALFALYQWQVRSYAVVDDVRIEQDPSNQGRVVVSFQVVSPGKVHYRRKGGAVDAEITDVFHTPGRVTRQWAWQYDPGTPIQVSVKYRSGLWTETRVDRFQTSNHADIVVLMDTTGTMGRYINMLNQKCGPFAERLKAQNVSCRFALIGFGDTAEPEWIDKYPFVADVAEFKRHVAGVKRFDGGDFPESSLDVLEEALQLPFEEGSMRRFYLVTDDTFHDPTRSRATVADVAVRLAKANVHLTVFTVPEFFADFERLRVRTNGEPLGSISILPIERFGAVLSEGRILEDD
jgi:hypothetical protein